MRMKARKSFRYANKALAADEEFTAETEQQALLMEAAGLATRAVKAEKPAKQSNGDATDTTLHTRHYKRRDMQAEGGDE